MGCLGAKPAGESGHRQDCLEHPYVQMGCRMTWQSSETGSTARDRHFHCAAGSSLETTGLVDYIILQLNFALYLLPKKQH